jgi:hypothetical protein
MAAPIEGSQRWNVERTNARHNAFNRLQRCHERRERVIDAFSTSPGAIISPHPLFEIDRYRPSCISVATGETTVR